jgi:hypothetical protein
MPTGLALGAACGGPAAARPMATATATEEPAVEVTPVRLAPAQPFLVAGENMSFELSYGGILTGRAVLAVGQPGQVDGRTVLLVRSMFETAGAAKMVTAIRDIIDTRLDWHTGAPLEHRGEAAGGPKRALAVTRFDGQNTIIDYELAGKKMRTLNVTLPPGETMHDLHSALGALRAWEPAPGEAAYFYSVSGRRVWRTELAFRGSEALRTAMGLRTALRFQGSSVRLNHRSLDVDTKKPARQLELWISDDAQRMPLRVVVHSEYGDFRAELVAYQRPEPHVSLN